MKFKSKYAAVQGTLPRRYEVAKWNEDQFLQFFEVVNHFTKDGVVKVTPEGLVVFEKSVLESTPSFKIEILYRINQFTSDPQATARKFYYKLASFIRQVGSFLKLYPAMVTDTMKAAIEPNPRLNWMLNTYKTYETKIGAEIVVPDTIDTTTFDRHHTVQPKNPEAQLMESMFKLSSAFKMIADSLTKTELRALSTDKKFKVLKDISDIMKQKSVRPNVTIFQNIKTNSATRDELEGALLDFARKE